MPSTDEQIIQWDSDWAERFPRRISGAQKERFLAELESLLQARGWPTKRITSGRLIRNRLLVTECERPSIIFLAHYDTPTMLPFWISWLFQAWGHTRQISGLFILILLLQAPQWLTAVFPNFAPLGLLSFIISLILLLSFIVVFIPNPRNREDNTSGVLGLMALADHLKDEPDLRERVQFAFLDNEEWGLLGSAALKKIWDSEGHPYQQTDIINLDCIARGQKPLLAYHKHGQLAEKLLPFIQAHLPQAEAMDMGIMPLSDNYTFRRQGAVDISFADRSLFPGGYYIPRIHTPRDDDFTPDRFWPLIQALGDYARRQQAAD
jgi:hypothetical protein